MEDFGFFGSSLKDALSDSVYFYEIASRDWRDPEYRSEVCSIASKPRFIINPKMPACETQGGGGTLTPLPFHLLGQPICCRWVMTFWPQFRRHRHSHRRRCVQSHRWLETPPHRYVSACRHQNASGHYRNANGRRQHASGHVSRRAAFRPRWFRGQFRRLQFKHFQTGSLPPVIS